MFLFANSDWSHTMIRVHSDIGLYVSNTIHRSISPYNRVNIVHYYSGFMAEILPIAWKTLCNQSIKSSTYSGLVFEHHGILWLRTVHISLYLGTWQSWKMSNKISIACHMYYDSEHTILKVIYDYLWHSHLLSGVWQLNGIVLISVGRKIEYRYNQKNNCIWEFYV